MELSSSFSVPDIPGWAADCARSLHLSDTGKTTLVILHSMKYFNISCICFAVVRLGQVFYRIMESQFGEGASFLLTGEMPLIKCFLWKSWILFAKLSKKWIFLWCAGNEWKGRWVVFLFLILEQKKTKSWCNFIAKHIWSMLYRFWNQTSSNKNKFLCSE